MGGTKIWKMWLWARWAANGAPKEPQRHQSRHRALKMKPKGAPRPPKWIPRGAQTPPNGAQATSRAPEMEPMRLPGQAPEMCARSPHDRTNIQTDAKTTTQQATTQTTEIKRPGGMREAIEYIE